MDLDVIIVNPMDDVIDLMLDPTKYKQQFSKDALVKHLSNINVMWPELELPDNIELMFTKDYNVVAPKRHDKPYQGGFFMIKPSLDTYNNLINIVKEGDYHVKGGWGKKVGPFYGGMTIQGLLPWYYEYIHTGTSVELNRCVYNSMNDNPMLVRDNGTSRCRTNQETCEDCRKRPQNEVVTFHFTICQKPWNCLQYRHRDDNFSLCREMTNEWYSFRSQLEQSWGRGGKGPGQHKPESYHGYCTQNGAKGYIPIEKPYGPQ
jgi:hypothetical protein